MQKIRMSKRGLLVIPANIRKKHNLKEGTILAIEDGEDEIKLRPKVKLRSLCGTWPELDIEAITKEIIQDRKDDE